MSDSIHNYKFGQMPTRKRKYNGKLYRRLEIGEIIKKTDLADVEEVDFIPKLVGKPYNPIREHRKLIIWRMLDE